MRASYDGPSEYTALTPLGSSRRGAAPSFRAPSPVRTPPAASASRPSGRSLYDSATGAETQWPRPSASERLNASASSFRPVPAAAAASSKRTSPARAGKPKASISPAASPDGSRPLCRYHFVEEGSCAYGERCRFSHSLPPGVTIEEARKRIQCQYYLRGNCKYGDACLLGHDVAISRTAVAGGGKPSPRRDRHEGERGEGAKIPIPSDESRAKKDDEDDRTCGICFEDVTATETGCFGLLSCCDHRFCLSCLRQWRRTRGASSPDVVRSCPTCRKKSDYVIPCRRIVAGAEKQRVVAEYRTRMAAKPCRKFDGTMGSCPFGRECFYAHLRDGVDVKAQDRDPAEMARERNRQNRRRHGGRRHLIPPWLFDDFAGTVDDIDDIEAIASFLALLSFYGYGIAGDSDDDDDNWDD